MKFFWVFWIFLEAVGQVWACPYQDLVLTMGSPILNEPSTVLEEWDFTDPTLFSEASSETASENLRRYQDEMDHQISSTDPIELLKRSQSFQVALNPEVLKVYEGVIGGEIGTLRALNCLEAFFYNRHLLLQNDFETEFQYFVLESSGSEGPFRYRVLFMSGATKGVAPSFSRIRGRIEGFFAQGIRLHSQTHNHPFFPNNPLGDVGGVLIPSLTFDGRTPGADAATLKIWKTRYQLNQAQITNGFGTLELNGLDIEKIQI